jgi:ATP-dependent Clp protease ATP-binding subunit ClpC
MTSVSGRQKDWFDCAETFLADWKLRDAERQGSLSACAEQVLELATEAALSLNHDAVGAEHLLAGVLKFNSGHAAGALRKAGLTLPALREEIESARGVVCEQKEVTPPIAYTPRCRGIIQRAEARVRSLEGARVEVEDLLLELLAERDGLPAQIFRRRAIDVEAIKGAVMRKACQ